MRLSLFFILIILLSSCKSNVNTDAGNTESNHQGHDTTSLRDEIYDNFEPIIAIQEKYISLFERTEVVMNSSSSYADLFLKMKNHELDSMDNRLIFTEVDSLTDSDRGHLWNLNETNYTSHLYHYCTKYSHQEDLTENQRDFVREFAFDSYEHTPNYDRVADILNELTEEEFMTKGIQECCLIYAVEYFSYDFRY